MDSYDDSDLEYEAEAPNWQENVGSEVLKVMKSDEKKRQDAINELFHTERTHVRNLKVLEKIFYRPMIQEQLLPAGYISLLFPNLTEILEIHSSFNQKMKAQRKAEPIIGNIGQLVLEMFDGSSGEHLKRAAAIYYQNHSVSLKNLKMHREKNKKLEKSLSDAEMNNLCRRLQLRDIILSGLMRFAKYPLLLENIANHTPSNTQELADLQHALECSKEILVHVNAVIKEAENRHRLHDIQKKMEKSSFEKADHLIVYDFKHLDVTKHTLLHEGPLTWRLSKEKTLKMHVVLLEELLILFQKQDEKYVLKFHNMNHISGREDTKIMHSPILRVHNILIRNNATDERSILIIPSSEVHIMYEFVAATATEKDTWCQKLTKAIEQKTHNDNLLTMHQEPVPVSPDSTAVNDETSEEAGVQSKEVFVNRKKLAKKEHLERQQHEIEHLQEAFIFCHILSFFENEDVRNDFLNGEKGAVQLTSEQLSQIDQFYKLIRPWPGQSTEPKQVDVSSYCHALAENHIFLVAGKNKEIVGTTYKALKDLLIRIKKCRYFSLQSAPVEEASTSSEDTREEEATKRSLKKPHGRATEWK